jgi:hypothetical protein
MCMPIAIFRVSEGGRRKSNNLYAFSVGVTWFFPCRVAPHSTSSLLLLNERT